MKKIFVLLVLLLSACNLPSAPNAEPPLPTAYIDPSYPTVEAAPVSAVQAANGIEARVNRAWRDGKEVHIEVCYTLLDTSDWSVWSASLQYTGGAAVDFGSTMLSLREAAEGQSGLRCDDLSFFNIPPDADLSAAVITIDAIAAPPRAEEYCSIYMPKIQQTLNERGIAIQLACVDSAGVQVMQIVSKPDSMSQEEAERIVYSDEFYTVKGPWSFAVNLGQ
ncbi:MAG: hypothetical protein L6Q26_12895 [Anaerolineales bacterium]|nr:hypothetical protein [Anaerolineales bacterium]NUQ84157.1 hypothetical protein [Anaerolineales bacterium]